MEHFQFHNAQSNAHCTGHLPAPRGVEERNSRGALINQDRLLAFAAPLSTPPPASAVTALGITSHTYLP